MSDVKRYEWDEDDGEWYCEGYTPVAGDALVRASDYDALAARLVEAEKDAALDREISQRNRDAVHELTERLEEAGILLDAWHCAYHGDRRMEAIDDDTTTWLAGISPFKDRAADSAPAARERKLCQRCYGKSPLCHRCQGTGMVDAPTSADDPSCPDCDGEGTWAK